MINYKKIKQSFEEDISRRGSDLLVYNYFGDIVKLRNVDISYDVHGKYRPPKEVKYHSKNSKNRNNHNKCAIL